MTRTPAHRHIARAAGLALALAPLVARAEPADAPERPVPLRLGIDLAAPGMGYSTVGPEWGGACLSLGVSWLYADVDAGRNLGDGHRSDTRVGVNLGVVGGAEAPTGARGLLTIGYAHAATTSPDGWDGEVHRSHERVRVQAAGQYVFASGLEVRLGLALSESVATRVTRRGYEGADGGREGDEVAEVFTRIGWQFSL